MIEVEDGPRILRFEGQELGFATSQRKGAGRWIEFTLYKTDGEGQYVLSRVGVSNVFHEEGCRFARRGNIEPIPWSKLTEESVPCDRVPGVVNGCRPRPDEFPLVYPEEDKTWARVYKTPEAVLSGLTKHGEDGSQYLTAVSKRLLESAAVNDPGIAGIYQVQTVL